MQDLLPLLARVANRRDEAEGIISLDLVCAAGGLLPEHPAGAHVDVAVGSLVRQYSLAGDPADRSSYKLGILLDRGSRGGSVAMHRFEVGSELRIGRPRNQFHLVEDATHTVLVAGGVGITPLLSMAHRLMSIGRSFELHYCASHAGRIAFRRELDEVGFAGHVHFHLDDDPSSRMVPQRALRRPCAETHLYVCGPTGFMDVVTKAARDLGYPEEEVHREDFSAVAVGGPAFTVTLAQSGGTYGIPEDQTIAQVLRSAGVDVEVSCEQGMCGTCLVAVLEGIPEHRDIYQTDEEKAANTHMTVCCSRASRGQKLVLDL